MSMVVGVVIGVVVGGTLAAEDISGPSEITGVSGLSRPAEDILAMLAMFSLFAMAYQLRALALSFVRSFVRSVRWILGLFGRFPIRRDRGVRETFNWNSEDETKKIMMAIRIDRIDDDEDDDDDGDIR